MKISKPSRVNGFLLEAPTLMFTHSGIPVCTMLVETDDGNHQYWQCWGGLAQTCANSPMKQGSRLSLEGVAKTQKWTDVEGIEHSREVYTASLVIW